MINWKNVCHYCLDYTYWGAPHVGSHCDLTRQTMVSNTRVIGLHEPLLNRFLAVHPTWFAMDHDTDYELF